MGPVSGKKAKGKGPAKQKNKKGKGHEGPDNQTIPIAAPLEQQREEQHREEQPNQEKVPTQAQGTVEQAPALPEPEKLPVSTVEVEEDTTLGPQTPNVASGQAPVNGAQNEVEGPEPQQERLGASELQPDTAESNNETSTPYGPDNQTDRAHAPIAATESLLMSPVPTSVPLPSPSLSEVQYMASPARSPVGSPAVLNRTSPPLKPVSPISRLASPVVKSAYPAVKSASPSTIYFPVPRAASAMPKAISPVPKVSSPLAHLYMSPAMSPTGTSPAPSAVPSAPPSTASSVAPVHHSPGMGSAGTVPPYASHRRPSGSHMYPVPPGYADPSYASSFQAIRDLSLNAGYGLDKGTISPPENDQELVDVLHRIQNAIPDINRLLHGFKHTQYKLSSREAEFKQMSNNHEQTLMHKEYYIDALQSQMKRTANESAEESTKLKNTVNELRLELGNLQDKQRDLEENLAASVKSNEDISKSKTDLEDQITKLNTSIQEAQEAHGRELDSRKEEQTEALASQKQELTELFEEIKNEDEKAAAEALETREKELLVQHESMKADYEKEKHQMQESHDTLQSEFDSKQTELAAVKEELEAKVTQLESTQAELTALREEVMAKVSELEEKQKELGEAHEAHNTMQNELRQMHANEVTSLKGDHEEELSASARVLAEKLTALKTYSEQEKRWAEEKAELENQLSQKSEELSNSEKEKEKLEEDGIVKEQQLRRAVEDMRTTINGLGKESDRLRKTLNSLGEATDLKNTKGDSFFSESFNQLSRLIISLSKDHFAHIPIDPPKDVLSKIPPGLPPFLDNTPVSRELRSAYVQHVVSKTLTYRIFQPFLFTLGRRYDKADTFFQMLSMDIRRKSVRRETFWRQQTLKAAYTASDAKQSINVVAAVIVDEIINQIKHLADPKQLDPLLTGVRKIVKIAAETWRLARVERELVLATFPVPDADDESLNDEWKEYGVPEKDGDGGPKQDGSSRHVILGTFPQIVREAAHEDFADDVHKANRCVYSCGTVLYSDSPVVLARLEELAKKEEAHASGEEGSRTDSRSSWRESGTV